MIKITETRKVKVYSLTETGTEIMEEQGKYSEIKWGSGSRKPISVEQAKKLIESEWQIDPRQDRMII